VAPLNNKVEIKAQISDNSLSQHIIKVNITSTKMRSLTLERIYSEKKLPRNTSYSTTH